MHTFTHNTVDSSVGIARHMKNFPSSTGKNASVGDDVVPISPTLVSLSLRPVENSSGISAWQYFCLLRRDQFVPDSAPADHSRASRNDEIGAVQIGNPNTEKQMNPSLLLNQRFQRRQHLLGGGEANRAANRSQKQRQEC